MPDGLTEVRRRYEAFMGEARAADAAANAEADAEYARLQQEVAETEGWSRSGSRRSGALTTSAGGSKPKRPGRNGWKPPTLPS